MFRQRLGALLAAIVWLPFAACTMHVKIEPSDKPMVVDLNVKVDHEVRNKVREQNQDLINMEDTLTAPRASASSDEGAKK